MSSSSSEPWGSKKNERKRLRLEGSIRRKIREQNRGVPPTNYEYRPKKERNAAETLVLMSESKGGYKKKTLKKRNKRKSKGKIQTKIPFSSMNEHTAIGEVLELLNRPDEGYKKKTLKKRNKRTKKYRKSTRK